MPIHTRISIIIPVFNEQATINSCLNNVKACLGNDCEIIVVDGSINGSTNICIEDKNIIKICGQAGRAAQMNAGAKMATGEILLFLHADTILPPNSAPLIREALDAPGAAAGAFSLNFDNNSATMRLISYVGNIRTRIERVPYGDQAPFIKKKTFLELGSYPLIPIMEDVEFFRNIKRKKLEIVILKESVTTSARRYKQMGMIRGFLRNWLLRILHLCGVSPFTLKKLYSDNGDKN
ncbi:TIGR04283 family arsenosugar biosynthesis glycosyltransferase [Maridesulfovibrio ferrireducens]|uniref:TIGR04283 family arsenosugar biosynthesis glycosyltransferase n=1 Tax=Maridesulfovibrio ferrireducens TaxID=246191 RepID=UPI001A288985|nr:TIGR04283 family arsenosugar biosynthesis glycosyltransferase [Maridesulfovibrio ferrireducens]MBI9112288.1 TIGR04283 family arsenosugar biosynthesis glycosyltransferase [Maridesulfovibrio ferrireducens]